MSRRFRGRPSLRCELSYLPRAQLPEPRQDRRRLHDLAILPPLFRAQRLARHGQTTPLNRAECHPSATGDRRDDLLQDPDLLLGIVQLPFIRSMIAHAIIERMNGSVAGSIRSASCPFTPAIPSCLASRFHARISTTTFGTARGNKRASVGHCVTDRLRLSVARQTRR